MFRNIEKTFQNRGCGQNSSRKTGRVLPACCDGNIAVWLDASEFQQQRSMSRLWLRLRCLVSSLIEYNNVDCGNEQQAPTLGLLDPNRRRGSCSGRFVTERRI